MRVLMVCAGNLSRSPSAALLLRRAVPDSELLIGSAGVIAPVGEPTHPWTASALTELGIDSSAHRARRLVPEHVEQADLVLAATRGLRADSVRHPSGGRREGLDASGVRPARRGGPAAADRDAARGPARPAERLRVIHEHARTLRGTLPRLAPEHDDIADPIEGPAEAHRVMVAEVAEVTDRLARLLS